VQAAGGDALSELPDPTGQAAEYLEKIVADGFRRELEQEENVVRSLSFFATSLGVLVAFLGLATPLLPPLAAEPVAVAAYAALAVVVALGMAGAARARETAHLRTLGMTRRETIGLLIAEHGPTVLVAFLGGTALGLALFVALRSALGLSAVVGSELAIPLEVDPGHLALLLLATVITLACGVGLAAALQRRAAPVAAIRRGIE
jgi:ABC-type antimicrobial peptide transport system permease subunit